MRNVASGQVRQRKAVAALKERLVRVASSRHAAGRNVLHLVYVDKQPYVVNEVELTWLREGAAPADIDLEPIDDDEDPFHDFP